MKQPSAIKIVFFLLMSLNVLGCAGIGKSLKALVGGGSPSSTADNSSDKKSKQTKFSDSTAVPYNGKNRNYQRMTRERFEDEAMLHESKDGSLWVMEGQGSYLFSSNTLRLVGDIVNVKLEGSPKSQLDTKVKVIKNLLAKLDKPKRKPAAVNPQDKNAPLPAPEAKPAETAAAPAADSEKDKEKEEDSAFQVESVPARISDRTAEGHYRVKGAQTFMIGKREYKVIVTGLVRASDMNGDEVSSSALLDPKFDIVSLKKELKL